MFEKFGGLGPSGPLRFYQYETNGKFLKKEFEPNLSAGDLLSFWLGDLGRAMEG